jgi:hypothetical protein
MERRGCGWSDAVGVPRDLRPAPMENDGNALLPYFEVTFTASQTCRVRAINLA